uniref:Uncharacterized protein n=1 Tax=Cannabis sativa TaxID=3483 RepID=A0A803P9Q6_CANSA
MVRLGDKKNLPQKASNSLPPVLPLDVVLQGPVPLPHYVSREPAGKAFERLEFLTKRTKISLLFRTAPTQLFWYHEAIFQTLSREELNVGELVTTRYCCRVGLLMGSQSIYSTLEKEEEDLIARAQSFTKCMEGEEDAGKSLKAPHRQFRFPVPNTGTPGASSSSVIPPMDDSFALLDMIKVGLEGKATALTAVTSNIVLTLGGPVEANPKDLEAKSTKAPSQGTRNSSIPSKAEQFQPVPSIPSTHVHSYPKHIALCLARHNFSMDAQTKGSAESDVLKRWINEHQDAQDLNLILASAAAEAGRLTKNLIDQNQAIDAGSQGAKEALKEFTRAKKEVENLKDNVLSEKTLRERDAKRTADLENQLKEF